MENLSALLDNYADAVANHVWAQEHGNHGDNRIEIARECERDARAAIVAKFRTA